MQSSEKCSIEFLTQSFMHLSVSVGVAIFAVAFGAGVGWYHPQDGAARKIYHI
jgi:hypothetical protein